MRRSNLCVDPLRCRRLGMAVVFLLYGSIIHLASAQNVVAASFSRTYFPVGLYCDPAQNTTLKNAYCDHLGVLMSVLYRSVSCPVAARDGQDDCATDNPAMQVVQGVFRALLAGNKDGFEHALFPEGYVPKHKTPGDELEMIYQISRDSLTETSQCPEFRLSGEVDCGKFRYYVIRPECPEKPGVFTYSATEFAPGRWRAREGYLSPFYGLMDSALTCLPLDAGKSDLLRKGDYLQINFDDKIGVELGQSTQLLLKVVKVGARDLGTKLWGQYDALQKKIRDFSGGMDETAIATLFSDFQSDITPQSIDFLRKHYEAGKKSGAGFEGWRNGITTVLPPALTENRYVVDCGIHAFLLARFGVTSIHILDLVRDETDTYRVCNLGTPSDFVGLQWNPDFPPVLAAAIAAHFGG